jgi:protein tyrosine phosphatase
MLYFSDGAGRTGTYITISNLLERMKIEQAMDVFQSIKMIRGTRPQFVENAVSTRIIIHSNALSTSKGCATSFWMLFNPKNCNWFVIEI